MISEFTSDMKCMRCYYAEPRYDNHGMMLGIECKAHNMRFIAWEEANVRYCGMFAERDEE